MPRNRPTDKVKSFGGLDNVHTPEDLVGAKKKGGQPLQTAQNVFQTDTGKLHRRPGSELSVSGDFHSLFSGRTGAFVAKDNTLQQINNNDITDRTDVVTTLTPGSWLSYEEVGDDLFWMTEAGERGRIRNGTNYVWGVETPAQPALSEGTGGLEAGRYIVAVTCRDALGVESGASPVSSITLTSPGGITVSLPDNHVGADTISIYCTEPNGTDLYEVGRVDDSVTSHTIQNMVAAGRTLQTQEVRVPPSGRILGYTDGRMYIASGPYVYYSEPFAPSWFKDVNVFWYETDVTDGVAADGGIYIGADKTYFVKGDNPKAASQSTVSDAPITRGMTQKLYPGDMGELATTAAAWVSDRGFHVGMGSGEVTLLSEDKYTFSPGNRGKLELVKRDGVIQLIALTEEADTPSDNDFGLQDRVSIEIIRNSVI